MGEKLILDYDGINWCWYMHIEAHEDGTVTVEKFYRLHRADAGHPATQGRGGHPHEESEGRVLQGITWIKNGETGAYRKSKVRNPGYVFGYQ